MNISLIPLQWKICAGAALAVALVVGAATYRHHVWQTGYDQAVSDRAASDGVAVLARVKDNAALSIKQDGFNTTITKAKDAELAPVVKRIYIDRVRVGPAICGPAASAQAESASGSDRADTSGRLVRSDVERDLRALKEAVEQDLATGRACQAFIEANGLVP